jgi:hypothetical protein
LAKFKAGDMIICKSDEGTSVLMVNSNDGVYYSLDDGNGFIDARDRIEYIDSLYEVCD